MTYQNDNFNLRRSDEDDNELWDDEIALSSEPGASSGLTDPRDDSEDPEDTGNPKDSDYKESSAEEDSKPSEPETPRRRRFGFSTNTDPEEENDYFDSDAEPEPETKTSKKKPVLDPENPDYWIEDEPEIPSIIPKGKARWKWKFAACLIPVALILAAWVWMFNPKVDGAVKYGYILHMERRGTLIKTFEGVMVPYREVGDATPLHFEKLRFSVESDTTAAKMKVMMLGCVPVRIEYKEYHTSLPWRGDEKFVVVRADTADIKRILPPEFRFPGEGKK